MSRAKKTNVKLPGELVLQDVAQSGWMKRLDHRPPEDFGTGRHRWRCKPALRKVASMRAKDFASYLFSLLTHRSQEEIFE